MRIVTGMNSPTTISYHAGKKLYRKKARRLRRFVKEWTDALRQEAPDLQVGFYNPGIWADSWSQAALARGMSGGPQPLLILDAGSYCGQGKTYESDDGATLPLPAYRQYLERILKHWGVRRA